jgi:hypothetical protein
MAKKIFPVCLILLLIPSLGINQALGRQTTPAGEVLITNPGDLVSAEFIDNQGTHLWRTLPYETEDFAGVMIAEGGGPGIPPVRIPLNITGRYKIHLGLFSGYYTRPKISVKLSQDKDFQELSLLQTLRDNVHQLAQNIYEVSWTEADLTGQDLHIAPNNDPSLWPVALAFIRLEPAGAPVPEPMIENPPLVVTSDGWGEGAPFSAHEHSKPEDLYRKFEVIPEDNRILMLIWGNGVGDWCNYPTKVGTYFNTMPGEMTVDKLRYHQINANLWKEKGWNSLEVMRDYADQRDWEFQVYIRMQGFGVLYPRGIQIQSGFFNKHPEYHCRDRDGIALSRLSYAYPEVQEHMLALIREISSYEPDGICLNFIRGLPLVAYEPVMVKEFQSRYGLDPRQLPETDPRWLDLVTEVTSAFVKQVKESLPDGQRLSAMIPGNQQDCGKYGVDVQGWLSDGLVDDLFPAGTKYNRHDVHLHDPESLDFKYFSELEGRERIRLVPLLYPWGTFESGFASWLKIFDRCRALEPDALAVWDVDIGHRYTKIHIVGEIDKYKSIHRYDYRRIPLKTLQGFRVDRYHYFEGI